MVEGTIYNINQEMGAFVAVENKYQGLILNKELYGSPQIGEQLMVRVKAIREDGKLELSLRGEAHNEIEGDAKVIMDKIEAHGGRIPFHDKSAPEQIKEHFQMSKAAFKRAVGRLLKEGVIEITKNGIKRRW